LADLNSFDKGLGMNKLATVSAFAALAIGGQAMAGDFSYDYIEGGVFVTDGYGNTDGKGLNVNGSKTLPQVHDNFKLIGGLTYYDFDNSVSWLNLSAGAGFHWPINSVLDVVGGLTLEYYDFDNDSDLGLAVSGGVRARPFGDAWEFAGGLKHVDVGWYEDNLVEVSGRYTFNPGVSAGVKLTAGDVDTLMFSVRWEL
jgi:hypothetical protein